MIHNSFISLSLTTIQEYLDAAKMCIENQKQDNGIYGMAALVLLCSAIDAIGSYYKKEPDGSYKFDSQVDLENLKYSVENHFRAVYKEFFSKNNFPEMSNLDENSFIATVYTEDRNKATHNAVVNNTISRDDAKTVITEKGPNGNILYINVLNHCVNIAFEQFKTNHPGLSVSEQANPASATTGVTASQSVQISNQS